MIRTLSILRELACILGLLFVAVALSPFWLAVLAWQRHQWQKQVNATLRGAA